MTLGSGEESDNVLRTRRVVELGRRGSSTVAAMRADILQVDGVTFCAVYENDTDSTDSAGRPPHSLEAVVLVVGAIVVEQRSAVDCPTATAARNSCSLIPSRRSAPATRAALPG